MQWLEHIDLLPQREIQPGLRGRFLHSDSMTFAFWEIDQGFDLVDHHHPHEQVMHMLEGEFELRIQEATQLVKPGAVTVIPGNISHGGKALTACRVLDIFYPQREDYLFNG